jgi:hypothetical protein
LALGTYDRQACVTALMTGVDLSILILRYSVLVVVLYRLQYPLKRCIPMTYDICRTL